jgi:hypothetical protein
VNGNPRNLRKGVLRASACIKIRGKKKERNMNVYIIRNGLEKIVIRVYFKMSSER